MNVSGPGGLREASPHETAEGARADATAQAAPAAAVRGGGSAVPAAVARAAIDYDGKTERRNVPDRSYGAIVDGRKEADGSWTVRVGTFPTTIAGPRPGAKPRDIATYTIAGGHVHRQPIDAAWAALTTRGHAPLVAHPKAADVERFKDFLARCEREKTLGALRRDMLARDAREDWFASEPPLAELVAKYGTPAQQAAYKN